MQNINAHKLKKLLNSLCWFLDNLYNINNGGCCYVAYLISKHLDRIGVKYKLVIYDYTKKQIDLTHYEIIHKVNSNNPKSSVTGEYTCNHYCLYIERGGIINNCNIDDQAFQCIIDGISSSDIKYIYRNGMWNNTYNSKNNKSVSKIISIFFKQYE